MLSNKIIKIPITTINQTYCPCVGGGEEALLNGQDDSGIIRNWSNAHYRVRFAFEFHTGIASCSQTVESMKFPIQMKEAKKEVW